MSASAKIGAIIPAGAASPRMGADKVLIERAGRRAVDLAAALARAAGAEAKVVAGGDFGRPNVDDGGASPVWPEFRRRPIRTRACGRKCARRAR